LNKDFIFDIQLFGDSVTSADIVIDSASGTSVTWHLDSETTAQSSTSVSELFRIANSEVAVVNGTSSSTTLHNIKFASGTTITLTLDADTTLKTSMQIWNSGNVIFDLNNHTITQSGTAVTVNSAEVNTIFSTISDTTGTLTVKNGNLVSNRTSNGTVIDVQGAGNVLVDNVSLKGASSGSNLASKSD